MFLFGGGTTTSSATTAAKESVSMKKEERKAGSGKGKGGKAPAGKKPRAKKGKRVLKPTGGKQSRRAGLSFPVGRVGRLLRTGNYASRVSGMAGVYLAAVLEYITAEVLELAGNSAYQNKHERITPRDIFLAIRMDEDLDKLFKDAILPATGALPLIHKQLLQKGSAADRAARKLPPRKSGGGKKKAAKAPVKKAEKAAKRVEKKAKQVSEDAKKAASVPAAKKVVKEAKALAKVAAKS